MWNLIKSHGLDNKNQVDFNHDTAYIKSYTQCDSQSVAFFEQSAIAAIEEIIREGNNDLL